MPKGFQLPLNTVAIQIDGIEQTGKPDALLELILKVPASKQSAIAVFLEDPTGGRVQTWTSRLFAEFDDNFGFDGG